MLKALGGFIDMLFKPLNALFYRPGGDAPKLVDKVPDYETRGPLEPLAGLPAPLLTVVAGLMSAAQAESGKRPEIEALVRELQREG
ncbi:MAG: hypothetical protein IMZ50_14900 [Candidatus Atribacteria bacterium]|nr:hypothetical protein [Candidatus Atribacteria bacterium]